jgi:hypothetical protein
MAGLVVAVLVLFIHLRPCQGGRHPRICHPERLCLFWLLADALRSFPPQTRNKSNVTSSDRSVPGFPATQRWTWPRVGLSVKKAA